MSTQQALPKDHPLMLAWEAYKQTEEYKNAKHWALTIQPMIQATDPEAERKRYSLMPIEQRERHIEGSLWAMFYAGWNRAVSRPSEAVAWKHIDTLPDSDDLVWLLRGDSIEGPRAPHADDADYWDYWMPCEPPDIHPAERTVSDYDNGFAAGIEAAAQAIRAMRDKNPHDTIVMLTLEEAEEAIRALSPEKK